MKAMTKIHFFQFMFYQFIFYQLYSISYVLLVYQFFSLCSIAINNIWTDLFELYVQILDDPFKIPFKFPDL